MVNVKKRVVVAMSGGVDSSVVAALLLEQGYEVIGLTMNHWNGTEGENQAVADAEKIASILAIPFHVVDFQTDFKKMVIDPFGQQYFAGFTPNPCIICNNKIKFGLLLDQALALGADYLATGHYVSLAQVDNSIFVQRGKDRNKDQSYFLFALTQQQLSYSIFPLGDLDKQQVRTLAQRFDLPCATKDESQDICFIPNNDYVSFLEQELGAGKLNGDIVHVSGKVLGRHDGVYRYTVGQRKGLGIGWTEPLYVVKIDANQKQVVVGEKEHLRQGEMFLERCSWNIEVPLKEFSTQCRIRYRHTEVEVMVDPLPANSAKVTFKVPQNGVTPGQAAVFYADDLVIGGGWIK